MIKTVLYMAMSANGLIHGRSGETPWGNEEWIKYEKTLHHAGCLIVGAKTHEDMIRCGEYDRLGVKRVVVLTNKDLMLPSGITANKHAKDALLQLEEEGFKEVIIGGGAETNAAFLKSGLVDEIILDIEPFLFGHGLPLFSPSEFDLELELIEAKPYAANSLGVRYKILSGRVGAI